MSTQWAQRIMLSQTGRTLWLNYPDKYTKIEFIGRLHLRWPLLFCRAIANGFHPTTHKISLQASKAIILPKTKASRYSHHLGQFALPETHWPFRVSGCDPYLNPYLNIYTTHHHGVSPWDSWNYAYHIQISCLSSHNHHFHLIHQILISPNHHVQFNAITHTKHINFVHKTQTPPAYSRTSYLGGIIQTIHATNHPNSQ